MNATAVIISFTVPTGGKIPTGMPKDSGSGEPVALLMPPATMDDPQSEWESRSVTSREVNRRWTEGSFLLKDNGRYYMMYSANYYGGQYYAV